MKREDGSRMSRLPSCISPALPNSVSNLPDPGRSTRVYEVLGDAGHCNVHISKEEADVYYWAHEQCETQVVEAPDARLRALFVLETLSTDQRMVSCSFSVIVCPLTFRRLPMGYTVAVSMMSARPLSPCMSSSG